MKAGKKKRCFDFFFPLVRLAEPYQVSLEENPNHITGENAMKSTEEIGIPIKFHFRVRYDLPVFSAVHPHVFMFSSTSEHGFFLKQIENFGRSLKDFANASLNIMWPKENSMGKWLLYLTHVSNENKQSIHCSPASEVNPLKDLKV